MTDSHLADELARERAAHRETAAALELERTAHAETRLVGVAAVEAANIYMGQLRAIIDGLQAELDTLRARVVPA
jgi:fructose-1,6-bisphosphatase/inositol monophosphatase family enzyme